jgi:hypothetical protein
LALKRQQVEVIQALNIVSQTKQKKKQGRSIMLFAIMATVFVSCPFLRNKNQ